MGAPRHTWIVTFDVVDDRRRSKLSRYLASRGERVQWSVFEVLANEEELAELVSEATVEARFLEDEDSLRCYRLCVPCRAAVLIRGRGRPLAEPGAPLVL